jgi:hypothetical protein
MLRAVVEEFRRHRLPRLVTLKEKVDAGGKLDDLDLEFLEKVFEDANRTISSTTDNHDLHDFCLHVVHLYNVITERALRNETG